MLSLWSIQRDNQGTLDQLSNHFSGVPQDPFEFSMIFDTFTNSSGSGAAASDSSGGSEMDSDASLSLRVSDDRIRRDSVALLGDSSPADSALTGPDRDLDSWMEWQTGSVDSNADPSMENGASEQIDYVFSDPDEMLMLI